MGKDFVAVAQWGNTHVELDVSKVGVPDNILELPREEDQVEDHHWQWEHVVVEQQSGVTNSQLRKGRGKERERELS